MTRLFSDKPLHALLAFAITVLAIGYVITLGYEPRNVAKSLASGVSGKLDGIWERGPTDPIINLQDELLPLNIPGPLDAWGGSRQHTITLLFKAARGKYKLKLEFYDCHESQPPLLGIKLNDGQPYDHQMKPGKGAPPPYGIVNGVLTFEIPVEITSEKNRLTITGVKGSWAAFASLSVYDYKYNPAKSLFSLLSKRNHAAIVFCLLILSLGIFLSAEGSFKNSIVNMTLLTTTILVSFIICEAIFRFYLNIKPEHRIIRATSPDEKNENPEGAGYTPATMIDISADPDLAYVLKPNLRGFFAGHPLKTNSFGMRGDEVPVEKPANTLRILGLGDSVLFGWGLKYEDSVMPVLAREIHDKLGVNTETLNTSVPSYNTYTEVKVYQKLGRKFKPDIVVLLLVGNDFGFPSSMVEPVRPFSLKKSYIVEQLRRFIIPYVSDSSSEEEDIVNRNTWERMKRLTGGEKEKRRQWLEEIERYYAKMAGKDSVAASLRDWAEMLREDGAKGILLYYPSSLVLNDPASYEQIPGTSENINDFIKQAGKQYGLNPIDMTPTIEAYLKSTGKASQKETLWLNEGDAHPKEIGAEMMAEEVVKVIIEKHLYKH